MFLQLKKTLHDFFSSNLVKLDLDPDPDPHSEKLLDPDPDLHKMNADPQPCNKHRCTSPFLFFFISVLYRNVADLDDLDPPNPIFFPRFVSASVSEVVERCYINTLKNNYRLLTEKQSIHSIGLGQIKRSEEPFC